MAPHQIPDQCASVITTKSSQISAGEVMLYCPLHRLVSAHNAHSCDYTAQSWLETIFSGLPICHFNNFIAFFFSLFWKHKKSFAFSNAQKITLEAHVPLLCQHWCGNVDTSSPRTNTISLQPEVILKLTLGFPGPFHIVMRYATPQHKGRAQVRAKILVVDEAGFQSCCDCKWRASFGCFSFSLPCSVFVD